MLYGDFQRIVCVNVHIRKDFASLEIWMLPPCFVCIYFRTRPEDFYTTAGARWSTQVSERTVSVLTKCVSFYAQAPPLRVKRLCPPDDVQQTELVT